MAPINLIDADGVSLHVSIAVEDAKLLMDVPGLVRGKLSLIDMGLSGPLYVPLSVEKKKSNLCSKYLTRQVLF